MPLSASGVRYFYDTEEPGLCVGVAATTKSYVFYRWHAGKPGRITIGKVGSVTLRDARRIAAGYRGDLARGIDVFKRDREQKRAKRPMTLAEAYVGLIDRPTMRTSTRRDYVSLWKHVPARLRTRRVW